jgi:hypothetical protein
MPGLLASSELNGGIIGHKLQGIALLRKSVFCFELKRRLIVVSLCSTPKNCDRIREAAHNAA